jgi:hypothetical protein
MACRMAVAAIDARKSTTFAAISRAFPLSAIDTPSIVACASATRCDQRTDSRSAIIMLKVLLDKLVPDAIHGENVPRFVRIVFELLP